MIFRDKKLKLISLNILLLASLSVLLGATPPIPTLPPAPSLPHTPYTEGTTNMTVSYEYIETTTKATTTEREVWTMPPTTTSPPKRPMFNVTFSPNIYGNFTGPIDLTLSNKTTGEIYTFSLYKSSNFFKMVEVTAGEYEMVGGMVSGDYNRKFPVELVSFSVGQYGNIMITFDVGTNPSPEKKTTTTRPITENPQAEVTDNETPDQIITTDEQNTTQDTSEHEYRRKNKAIKIAAHTTLIGMMLIFTALIALVIYKRKENNK